MKRRQLAERFSGQKVLLVGLGLHGGGVATVRWLVKHGAIVRVTDQKTSRDLSASVKKIAHLDIQWRLGVTNPADVAWADIIVQNPGVASSHPLITAAERRGKLILNEASIFISLAPCPIIGVTGTRGKTTTTLLIAHLLKAGGRAVIAAGNFREVPMLAVLDRLTDKDLAVVELSSFHLEGLARIHRSPQIAVWTNLHVDHLNRYRSMIEYAQAKSQILRWQRPRDVAILNADAAAVRVFAGQTSASIVWFSSQHAAGPRSFFLRHGWICESRGGRVTTIVRRDDFPLPGDHQVHNLLAAVATVRSLGVSLTAIRQAVKTFRPIPHRQQRIRSWRGHEFINDTTATSPEGAVAGMMTYPQAVYILGGTDKSLDFSPLVQRIIEQRPSMVFLPGSATEKIFKELKKKKWRDSLRTAASMEQAVKEAIKIAQPGQAIVLTPGAASFGLFRHEFDRGEQFRQTVMKRR